MLQMDIQKDPEKAILSFFDKVFLQTSSFAPQGRENLARPMNNIIWFTRSDSYLPSKHRSKSKNSPSPLHMSAIFSH